MATKLITKKKFLDRNYFIKAAFGVLNKSFGSKSSLDYVKKIRRTGKDHKNVKDIIKHHCLFKNFKSRNVIQYISKNTIRY
jgi:hypothetical protein